MAGEAEQLVVSLEARIRDFERNFQRANKIANDNFGGIERRARTAGKNLETSMAGSTNAMSRSLDSFGAAAARKLGGAFAAITAGVGLNELRKSADEYTKIMNSLKVAGVKDADLPTTFDKLFASAQRNAAPLDALATLYGRVSAAQTTLKASSQDVMRLTDITAQSLRVGGTSASQASGALLQLGQALAGGKIQSEEFNSLIDGMRPLLQAAASGLVEAGGDVAKLTTLVKDGKVSSEAFFRAILAGAPVLEEKLAGSVITSEQALQRLSNEWVRAVGEFDKATGASAALAGAIDGLAGSIGGIGRAASGAVVGVQSLIAKVGELAAANGGVLRQQGLLQGAERAAMRDQAREMGLANSGGRDKLAAERATADTAASQRSRESVSGFRQQEIADANRMMTAPQPPARPAGVGGAGIKPVSLKDYAVPGEDKAGGGGGSSAEKLSRYEKEIQAIQRRTEALQAEAATVGKGTAEIERSKIALQLEQAAKRDGITISDQMRTAIDAAANGYANAKMRVEDLKTALDGARDAQKFFATEITDGLVDMVVEGKSATEVVNGLAKSLLKAALQAALMGSGPLGGLFGGGGKDGAMGGLFGMLGKSLLGFAGGGYTGDGGKHEPAGVVHRGEFVMSKAAVARIGVGNLDAMHRGALKGFADGGLVGAIPQSAPALPSVEGMGASNSVSQNVNVTVNATGGDPKQNKDLADQIGRRVQQELRGMIGTEIKQQLRPGGILR